MEEDKNKWSILALFLSRVWKSRSIAFVLSLAGAFNLSSPVSCWLELLVGEPGELFNTGGQVTNGNGRLNETRRECS
ncbi:hypothetical protein RRG08_015449 [Elysia crispata]|uniref:Uncharacterized protein n=1 Tax=Elysia crispata TaxID=231223 RepID=A0AAE0YHD9_9GAST|nr:hypothetical protein RRG08_015449 [Elysia crispata]